jgi:hypothetical protein
VVGTVLLFVPGGQPFGIGILAGAKIGTAVCQFTEGETTHGFKSLGLAGLSALPALGRAGNLIKLGSKTVSNMEKIGQTGYLVGNSSLTIIKTADAIERGDKKGVILNLTQAVVGMTSLGAVNFSEGYKVIDTAEIIGNSVTAGVTGVNIVNNLNKEETDWCELVNDTCAAASSIKLAHDGACRLLSNFDSLAVDKKGSEVIVDANYNKERIIKLKDGYYLKENIQTREEVRAYQIAYEIGVGPEVKVDYQSKSVMIKPGMKIQEAIKNDLISKQEAIKQVHQLKSTLCKHSKGHCDAKPDNCLYFPQDNRILLIDNGNIKNYGEKRKVKTHKMNTTLNSTTAINSEDGIVGKGTDGKGFRAIITAIESC